MQDNQKIDSKFRSVLLASHRAKQILNGSRPKIETKLENPLSIALEEIKAGVVDFSLLVEEQGVDKNILDEIGLSDENLESDNTEESEETEE